jgi:hypothetical protein
MPPDWRHALAPIKATIFFSRPGLLIAPRLKIGFGPVQQEDGPCRLEIGACLVESRRRASGALARMAAGVEAAMPLPGLPGIRDARALDDQADPDPGIMDVPSHGSVIDALAGEDGRGPMMARPAARVKPQDIMS